MHSRIVIARPQGGRGNLAVPGGITGKPRRKRNCLPEIAPQGHFLALRAQGATAPLGPRNDKSEGIAPLNLCRDHCQSARRSGSAAAGSFGNPCKKRPHPIGWGRLHLIQPTTKRAAALAKWASFRLSAICTCRGWVKLIVNSSIKFFALTTCSPSTTSMA